MLRNYLISSIRVLMRNKAYAAINIFGLALGISCATFIFQMVNSQFQFDNFHAHVERMYRVVTVSERPSGMDFQEGTPTPLAEALRTDFPDMEVAIISGFESGMIAVMDGNEVSKRFDESTLAYAEPQMLDIATFTWLAGNKTAVLRQPNTGIISKSLAQKYFGSNDPIGQRLVMNNEVPIVIDGVFEDMPVTSDFIFDLYISYSTNEAQPGYDDNNHMGSISSNDQTFVLLPAGLSLEQVQSQMPDFMAKYHEEKVANERTYYWQPLSEMHFDGRFNTFVGFTAGKELTWVLSIIAVLLVFTACINFVNLATAQSLKRAKEVGVRKVLGGTRNRIFYQFIAETFMITLLAILLSLGLTELLVLHINSFFELKGIMVQSFNTDMLIFLVGVTVLVTLAAGFYPAMIMSGFQPAVALKSKLGSHSKGQWLLRKGLVVLQFAISQFLIVGTIVMTSQIDFFVKKDVGFRRNQVITTGLPNNNAQSLQQLKQQLLASPHIEGVTFGGASPTANSNWITNFFYKQGEEELEYYTNIKFIDEHYLENYEIKLLAGQNVTPNDSVHGLLINAELMKVFGFTDPQEAIGYPISLGRGGYKPITGVLDEFFIYSLQRESDPLVMVYQSDEFHEMAVMANPSNVPEALKAVEAAWTAAFPDFLFDHNFLSDRLKDNYEEENVLSKLIRLFAIIAILIGCMGLYGLVSFMAAQKTKEIGIRKVLGASVGGIVVLFSKEFLKLLFIAFGFAAVLGYLAMDAWLSDFVYRIPLSPVYFLVAIVASLLIAALTVGWKSLKAATSNPVLSLRDE